VSAAEARRREVTAVQLQPPPAAAGRRFYAPLSKAAAAIDCQPAVTPLYLFSALIE